MKMNNLQAENSRYWAEYWDGITKAGKNKGPMTPGFWNHMAHRYARDTPAEQEEERIRKIFDLITSTGIQLKGAQVLDIGAGTGSLSIPLAKLGADVTALDFSEEMLKKLENRAKEERVTIRTIHRSWDTIDIKAEGFYKKFDLVIASMTPAVRCPDDLSLMLEAGKGICYYSGWVNRKWDYKYYEMYQLLFNEEFKEGPHGFYLPFMYLYMLGYRPVVSLMQDEWSNNETVEESVETASGFFSVSKHIDESIKSRIRAYLTMHAPDGINHSQTQVITGMMVWDMKQGIGMNSDS